MKNKQTTTKGFSAENDTSHSGYARLGAVLLDMETSTKLLSMFRGFSRPSLQHFMPFDWNDKKWIGATDAMTFIILPENELNKIPVPEEKTVNLAGIIPVFDKEIEVEIEHLKAVYSMIEKIENEITHECSNCDGDGDFYHNGFTYECQNCNETGLIKTGRFEQIKNPKKVIKLSDSTIAPSLIEKLLLTIQITNPTILKIRFSRPNGLLLLELDNSILIGLMSKKDDECEVLPVA